MKDILGATWHKTQTLLDCRKTTKLFEEIEGSVTKRLLKVFSRTESRILGALARLDDFLMNPLLQNHSGTTLEPSRNASGSSQGTNEDNSQNDLHPEASLFHGQMTRNSGPEDGHNTEHITITSVLPSKS